jgi:hypothetical protein
MNGSFRKGGQVAGRWIGALAALLAGSTGAGAIVGGREGESPLGRASVMVLSSSGGVCSAVVVARDVVLTAGHCATGAAEYRVHFRGTDGEPVMIAPAARAIHPGYDSKAIERRRRSVDLALVRVPAPLPERFETAVLSPDAPSREAGITIGGWGVAREGDGKSSGTFRTASLRAVEPYGPSRILVWARGAGAAGACQGDSGGPLSVGTTVFAITSWSTGPNGRICGDLTQGILLGPQREWIDRTLAGWGRSARWE